MTILFAPDFPKRVSHSIAARARLSKEERQKLGQIATDAMQRARITYRQWEDGVCILGELRYTPAIPLLGQLWRDCALMPVRNSAGHALLSIGTPASCHALEKLHTDYESISIQLGIRAFFRRDPFAAFDRFAPLFAVQEITAVTLSHEVLSLFAPSMFLPDGSVRWIEREAPVWLKQAPRWLTLCAGLCQDETHGAQARTMLRYADPNSVLLARESARAKRPPPPVPVTRAIGDLVSRYQARDHLGTMAASARLRRDCGRSACGN